MEIADTLASLKNRVLQDRLDQLEESIVLLSPDSAIEYVNPGFEAMSGYRYDEVVGRSWHVLHDYLIGQSYADMASMAGAAGKFLTRQKRRRKNGEVFLINLSITPVRDASGKIINYVAVGRDITQEVRLQQQLNQSQKMEALGTLAGGIAHDLNNSFTPILIDTELLMDDALDGDLRLPILEEMLGATRHGVDGPREPDPLLTFSRRAMEEKELVKISPIIGEALAFLRSVLPSTIDIRSRLAAGDVVIPANPTQIKQVLINLGVNAGYAMREYGGILDVELSCVDIDETAASESFPDLNPGPYVRLTVTDTGCGMDEKTMGRIFDPFFSTRTPGEGTGMGLSVVHGIVRDHGGIITVRSEPGHGTTFTVLLPRLKGQQP